jgi:hypothetical protein
MQTNINLGIIILQTAYNTQLMLEKGHVLIQPAGQYVAHPDHYAMES